MREINSLYTGLLDSECYSPYLSSSDFVTSRLSAAVCLHFTPGGGRAESKSDSTLYLQDRSPLANKLRD
jgi:hypothetical protein